MLPYLRTLKFDKLLLREYNKVTWTTCYAGLHCTRDWQPPLATSTHCVAVGARAPTRSSLDSRGAHACALDTATHARAVHIHPHIRRRRRSARRLLPPTQPHCHLITYFYVSQLAWDIAERLPTTQHASPRTRLFIYLCIYSCYNLTGGKCQYSMCNVRTFWSAYGIFSIFYNQIQWRKNVYKS